MAFEGYMTYDGIEFINVARTQVVSEKWGPKVTRLKPRIMESMLHNMVGSENYENLYDAPWYDARFAPSREFFGLIPISVGGLDDSSLQSSPVEYIGDGGHSGKPRNTTQPLVFDAWLIASTERGAEYGKRWLERLLTGNRNTMCAGADLHYLAYVNLPDRDITFQAPLLHRRDVSLSRGISVTAKKVGRCSTLWRVTWTMTAADPFEYGAPVQVITSLGKVNADGDYGYSTGLVSGVYAGCPVYDYSPIYDPYNPALVPSPVAPNFYPAGWQMDEGMPYTRAYMLLHQVDPGGQDQVPVIRLRTPTDARMIRVSVYSALQDEETQCDPLFSTVVTYIPANSDFYIDAEQQACYIWDGNSDYVKRTDSLVYGPNAAPVDWTAFSTQDGLLVCIDTFEVKGTVGDPINGANLSANPNFTDGLYGWDTGVYGAPGAATLGYVEAQTTPADTASQNAFGPKRAHYAINGDVNKQAFLTNTGSTFDVIPTERIYVSGNFYVDGTGPGTSPDLLVILYGLAISKPDGSTTTLLLPTAPGGNGTTYPSNIGYVNFAGYLTIPAGYTRAYIVAVIQPNSLTKNVYFGKARASSARTVQAPRQVEMKMSLVSKSG